jgi:transcriptional regulator with XRE-family HTH domain
MPSRDPRVMFGKTLCKLREGRDLSQKELAEKASLSLNMVGLLERGRRNPSLITVVKLAKALRVNASKFFDEL